MYIAHFDMLSNNSYIYSQTIFKNYNELWVMLIL